MRTWVSPLVDKSGREHDLRNVHHKRNMIGSQLVHTLARSIMSSFCQLALNRKRDIIISTQPTRTSHSLRVRADQMDLLIFGFMASKKIGSLLNRSVASVIGRGETTKLP